MAGNRQKAFAFLAALLSVDILFLVLHFIHSHTPYLAHPSFSVEKDRGFGELFQFGKELFAAVILVALFLRTRQRIYLAWSLLFGYILLDDSLQIHERVGKKLSQLLGYSPSLRLRTEDFGELTVSAFVGLSFMILIGGAYFLSSPEARRVTRHLVPMLGILVFFGIFIDMLHIALTSMAFSSLLGAVEDGGEMLTMSVLCWYLFLRLPRSPLRSLQPVSSP